jgi:hypothetical protein
MSHEQEQDREFEAYLKGESPLSQTYAGMRGQEPPARLDHAILAEAHRAVGGGAAGARGRPAWRRWSLPLSLAATLVVAVLVGLELPYVSREPAVTQPASAPEEAPGVSVAAKREAAGRVAADKVAADKRKVAPAPQAAPAAESVELDQAFRPAPRARSPEAPAPGREKSAVIPAAPAPAVSPGAEEALPMNTAPAAAAPAANTPRLEATPETRSAPADRSMPPAQESAAPAAAMLAAPPQASGLAQTPGPQQAWLQRIRQLEQAGKRDEAKKELATFTKRYPDYPVPKELQGLR